MSIDYKKLDFTFEKIKEGVFYSFAHPDIEKRLPVEYEPINVYSYKEYENDLRKICQMAIDICPDLLMTEENKANVAMVMDWSYEFLEKYLSSTLNDDNLETAIGLVWKGGVIYFNYTKIVWDRWLISIERTNWIADFDRTDLKEDFYWIWMECTNNTKKALEQYINFTGRQIWCIRATQPANSDMCEDIVDELDERTTKVWEKMPTQEDIDNAGVIISIDNNFVWTYLKQYELM